jgi:hypothetical protein
VVKAIRLPALIDVVFAEEPRAILALSEDTRLDRDFAPRGPLLNRIVARRIRRVLHVGGTPLPAVAPRGAARPSPRQSDLEARLDGRLPDAPCSEAHLRALSGHVLGRPGEQALGPLVQEVLGCLFRPDYRADAESWEAARLLDRAVRSNNPLRHLVWRVSGRVERARRGLAERVDGDPAALHTTGIAAHNLVSAFERMRDLAARPGALRHVASPEAASRCLVAPESVLRQATRAGTTPAASFRPGTLVLFRLEAARARSLRHDVAFMTGSWSRCPANAWVPRLFAAVWDRAAAEHHDGRPAS